MKMKRTKKERERNGNVQRRKEIKMETYKEGKRAKWRHTKTEREQTYKPMFKNGSGGFYFGESLGLISD